MRSALRLPQLANRQPSQNVYVQLERSHEMRPRSPSPHKRQCTSLPFASVRHAQASATNRHNGAQEHEQGRGRQRASYLPFLFVASPAFCCVRFLFASLLALLTCRVNVQTSGAEGRGGGQAQARTAQRMLVQGRQGRRLKAGTAALQVHTHECDIRRENHVGSELRVRLAPVFSSGRGPVAQAARARVSRLTCMCAGEGSGWLIVEAPSGGVLRWHAACGSATGQEPRRQNKKTACSRAISTLGERGGGPRRQREQGR